MCNKSAGRAIAIIRKEKFQQVVIQGYSGLLKQNSKVPSHGVERVVIGCYVNSWFVYVHPVSKPLSFYPIDV